MNQKKTNNLIETDDVILPRRFTFAFPILHDLVFLTVKNLGKNPGIYYTMSRL